LPKQNRPLVRDGRIQTRKKRTDRSYLRPNSAPAGIAEETAAEEEDVAEQQPAEEAPLADATAPEAVAPRETAPVSTSSTAPAPVNGATASTNGASTAARATGTVRALQQQGVRKRREFDVNALAIRDSKYALHEIRRIAILATMVVITLVVLSFVLR